ncbi:MAG: hypothetical protein V7761_01020, partial [Amylibacter sp.]
MARKTKNQDEKKKKPARLLVWLAGKCRHMFRIMRNILIVTVTAAAILVLLFRIINPPINIYIASEWYRLGHMKRDWTRVE